MSLGVFDIETLGLNPQYCPIVLAGFLEPDAGGACRITQYFAEVPEDERLIIKRIQDDLRRVEMCIRDWVYLSVQRAKQLQYD